MQSKHILVALLLGANAWGYSFITPEEVRSFDLQFFHSGANIFLAMAVLFVSVVTRKLAMFHFGIPEQGLWLPAIICIGETVLCGLAIILAGYVAPSYFTYSSVLHELMFWFGVGSFVVILKIAVGDLPVDSQKAN